MMQIKDNKKRIMVDLDVITVAYFPSNDLRKEYCLSFIERANKGEFEIITPSNFEILLRKWKFRELRDKILDFYKDATTKFIDKIEIIAGLNIKKISFDEIEEEFKSQGIKEEDILIILIASIQDLDYVISYNRKHLKNMEKKINEVLKRNGLSEIRIMSPNEI